MAATALGAARPMLVVVALDKAAGLRVREWVKVWDSWRIYRDMICTITNFPGEKISFLYSFVDGRSCLFMAQAGGAILPREGANKQVISSQADSLIKISRIWADFFPANTSNQPI
ncbi:hypothetical protein ACS6OZ_24525 [Enterobacter hormaechei subsp. steigerwaltii]|uniref:hypothetical protein n=1 Tax=Enterobacter hormaechei TaxID=158836 RepID=UPI00216183A1|nr:hypothetical protein [Enterobacter hormaechei]MCS0509986.1 hypothetical protein [Enterobacter hormaechei]